MFLRPASHVKRFHQSLLFQLPLPEPCVRLSTHTALQFPVGFGFDCVHLALAAIPFGTFCRPSSCPRHYPRPLATMAAPSP